MPAAYHTVTVKVRDTVVHSEIVKVVADKEEQLSQISNYRFRMMVLDTLFARDSMSPDSPVRPIREIIDSLTMIGQLNYRVELKGSEEEYSEQQLTRVPSQGYLFNEVIEHFWLT